MVSGDWGFIKLHELYALKTKFLAHWRCMLYVFPTEIHFFFTENHRKSFLSTLLVVLLGLLEVGRKGSKAIKSFSGLFAIAAAHY